MPYTDKNKQREYSRNYAREWCRRKRADPTYRIAERTRSREREQAHPEIRRARIARTKDNHLKVAAEWRRNNPDKLRTYKAKYWIRHKDNLSAKQHKCYKDNPEPAKAARRRRRAILLNAPGYHTQQQWISRVDYHGWRCRYCNCALDNQTLSCDHMIPISKGGSDWASNLVPSCLSCNHRKHVKTFKEFVA